VQSAQVSAKVRAIARAASGTVCVPDQAANRSQWPRVRVRRARRNGLSTGTADSGTLSSLSSAFSLPIVQLLATMPRPPPASQAIDYRRAWTWQPLAWFSSYEKDGESLQMMTTSNDKPI
jgi:hypothetical protein